MHDILRNLQPGSFVLDLGCAQGSFAKESTAATIVRFDRVTPQCLSDTYFVRGDATELPFASHSFAAVIANHSLEHFQDLNRCLREIRRILVHDGSLFVSIPDASTFTDKLYRWLARGGGHINQFSSADDVVNTIERSTHLRRVAVRTLFSSLSFLNARNSPRPLPLRLLLLGGGHEWSLFLYVWLSRRIDRLFGFRTSIYGWALYFGSVPEPVDTESMVNVCIRCGSGHTATYLRNYITSWMGIKVYQCPNCGAANPFLD